MLIENFQCCDDCKSVEWMVCKDGNMEFDGLLNYSLTFSRFRSNTCPNYGIFSAIIIFTLNLLNFRSQNNDF